LAFLKVNLILWCFLSLIPHEELCNIEQFQRIAEIANGTDFEKKAYIFQTAEDKKLPFADWIVERASHDATLLEPFKKIIEGLEALIK